jgi:gamma-glutamylcyclotransferase (GGCT)/AIG2-like uncharacterized protein YtfP
MANWLADHAYFAGQASVVGQLYDVGSYPAFSLSPGRDSTVSGDLYRLTHPRPLLRKLDHYEGIGPGHRKPYEYRRVRLPVILADGARQQAWVYVYAWSLTGLRPISGGDYLRWCRKR